MRFLTALLALWASMSEAAEATLRPDLAGRLAQLWPIYGEGALFDGTQPVLAYDAVRVIGLSGVIAEGDAARLKAVIGPEDGLEPFILVMNSPGGSFVEGVRIGEMLQPYRGGNGDPLMNGVIVLKGEQCMSACAVAFALAALPRDSGLSVRFVEVGAKLGFHMPFVPEAQQAQQTEISRAMDLTYEVMSQYIRMVGNGLAPVALVQNALHYRRPDQFFLLTGGLVTRFMDFVPVVGPQGGTGITIGGLTQRDALNMCQVLQYSSGRRMTSDEYEWWPLNSATDDPETTPLKDLFQRVGARRISTDGCVISWNDGDVLGIAARGDCAEGAEISQWCAVTDPNLPPLPRASGALLGDSLGCHGGRLTQKYYTWDWRNEFLEEETPASYRWDGMPPEHPVQMLDWSGATLKTNVNLRTGPGGDKIAELAVGAPVSVTGCTLSADGQGVWYQVAVPGAQTGWVSARFVAVPSLAGSDFMIRPVDFQ